MYHNLNIQSYSDQHAKKLYQRVTITNVDLKFIFFFFDHYLWELFSLYHQHFGFIAVDVPKEDGITSLIIWIFPE